MAEAITELKKRAGVVDELEEFKKRHTEAFLYFLEEYDKWRALRKSSAD